jgi:hypothetical protein
MTGKNIAIKIGRYILTSQKAVTATIAQRPDALELGGPKASCFGICPFITQLSTSRGIPQSVESYQKRVVS